MYVCVGSGGKSGPRLCFQKRRARKEHKGEGEENKNYENEDNDERRDRKSRRRRKGRRRRKRRKEEASEFVGWLVGSLTPQQHWCISGTDLLRQLYALAQ